MLPVSDSVCAGMIQRVPVETGRKYIIMLYGWELMDLLLEVASLQSNW